MKRYLPFIIIVLVLVGTALGGFALYRSKIQKLTRKTSAAPAQSKNSGFHTRGEAGAPVTLEEFGDFQCPSCRSVFLTLEEVEREYGKKLRVIFHELPLPMHRYAMLAARSAEAAGLQGHFWEMHDMLYRNQDSWSGEAPLPTPPAPGATVAPDDLADTPEKFREYAKKIGVNMAEFERDMDSKQVLDRIEADRKRADAMDVQVTPTLFVNGQRLLFNSMNPQGLRKAIDDALAPKTSPSPSAHP